MIMRPIFRVVVVLADFIHFAFRLDIAVLRDADEHACPILRVVLLQIHAGIRQRLMDAVDRNRPSPCPDAYLLAFLIFRGVVCAKSRERVAKIANVVRHDSGHAIQQIRTELAQGVAVRRRQPYSCDDNAFLVVLHGHFLFSLSFLYSEKI